MVDKIFIIKVAIQLTVLLVYSIQTRGYTKFSSLGASVEPLIDRVPTYRLYQDRLCQGQVSGRGDVHDCRTRLHEAITSLTTKITGQKCSVTVREAISEELKEGQSVRIPHTDDKQPSSRHRVGEVRPVLELESEQALQLFLEEQDPRQLIVIEFYGRSCKQCKLMDPMYASLPYSYRHYPVTFCRADVTVFPSFIVAPPDPRKFENLDRSQTIEERLEGCPRCGGSGFVTCENCRGQGHIVKTVNGYSVADICMVCVGHKKSPCTQCGGKCYLC